MDKTPTILVTGGSRGIGRAIVERFAADGANVGFTYRAAADRARALVEGLRARHPAQRFSAWCCDAADAVAVATLVPTLLAELETIDVLVNNAGITRDASILAMTAEDWDQVLATNLTGVFHLTQKLVFEMMKRRAGAVINVTSVSGLYGNAGQVNYSSAKAGLVGFTKALAKEVGRAGIRVNAVAPGFIDTDMTGQLTEADRKKLLDRITLRRMGTATEIADAVAFLASPRAAYITGTVLSVDGGIAL
jgi:3-oxoacyl-[acyl-carrier protein] reductase